MTARLLLLWAALYVVALAPTTPTTRPAAAAELDAFWSTPTRGRGAR